MKHTSEELAAAVKRPKPFWVYDGCRTVGGQMKAHDRLNSPREKTEKQFNVMYGIGKAKYVVNYHDGEKTHSDGSPFFDIRIFSNKKELERFTRDLRLTGYVER